MLGLRLRFALVLAALALIGVLLYGPSCALPVDAVAELERESGVPLESLRVATNGIELHVVAAGPPDEVARSKGPTGEYLARYLR